MIRDDIHAAIKEELISLGAPEASFVVERPGSLEHGDYTTNVAFSAAKILKKSPIQVTNELVKTLEGKVDGIQNIVPAAGFINFSLSQEAVVKEIRAAATNEKWGSNDLYADKVVMVEYTDPNPFKEFHIGHLMSNAIGESVARLLEASGAEVKRANYQGDVGPHVAKALYVLMEQGVESPTIAQISEAYVEGVQRYEENPVDKEAINDLNKKIYDQSDERVNTLYRKGKDLSLKHFEELYKKLGTKFDFYFFESKTGPLGLKIVRSHPDIFEESEGAIIFRGENYGLHTRVFVNKLGLPTYETKELGLVEAKEEKGTFDLSLTVTANETAEYFKVVRKAAELVSPDLEGRILVRFHGLMRLTSGKMSSRKGNVITGESLLEALEEQAKEKMRGRSVKSADIIAEEIAVGAVKYAVLKSGSGKDVVFDPEKSLSLEGDSGPYLQYAHTRALSLVRAAKDAGVEPSGEDIPDQVSALERMLLHYPDVLARAAHELEPHYVTTFLTELASAFNSWYASERVIGGEHPSYGLLLASAVERTLRKGLNVLGIPAPEEM